MSQPTAQVMMEGLLDQLSSPAFNRIYRETLSRMRASEFHLPSSDDVLKICEGLYPHREDKNQPTTLNEGDLAFLSDLHAHLACLAKLCLVNEGKV